MADHFRFLFIPASGDRGSGEYFRSLQIAHTLKKTFEDPEIHFILNKQAPYINDCPYASSLIGDTPTYVVSEVNKIILDFKPDVVFFDATGRSVMLKTTKSIGAKTIFIAQNPAILNRALGLNRLAVTDEVWIVQPDYILSPGMWNRLKMKLAPVTVKHIGPVYPFIHETDAPKLRQRLHELPREYVLFNPGGGGHEIQGEPAIRIFERCAADYVSTGKYKVVLVYGPNYMGEMIKHSGIITFPKLPPDAFQAVIMGARASIGRCPCSHGGSSAFP